MADDDAVEVNDDPAPEPVVNCHDNTGGLLTDADRLGAAAVGCQPLDGADTAAVADDVVDSSEALAAAASSSESTDTVSVAVQVALDDVEPHAPPPAAAAVPNEDQPAAAAAAARDDADAVDPPAVNAAVPAPAVQLGPQGLGDVHQAMMQGRGPVGFQAYKQPNLFALRVSMIDFTERSVKHL